MGMERTATTTERNGTMKLSKGMEKALVIMAEAKTQMYGVCSSSNEANTNSLDGLVKRGLVDVVSGRDKPRAFWRNAGEGKRPSVSGMRRTWTTYTWDAGWIVSTATYYKINYLGLELAAELSRV